MSFRVTARTILQLGAELISSDGIAFYELIKNAFDAGSRRVDIDVYVRLDHDAYKGYQKAISDFSDDSASDLEELKAQVVEDVDITAPKADDLRHQLMSANSLGELSIVLDDANYIEIKDSGHGMSANDLEEIYLTIGTPHRRKQRAEQSRHLKSGVSLPQSARPILGEKGLGRLSAMRLGWLSANRHYDQRR